MYRAHRYGALPGSADQAQRPAPPRHRQPRPPRDRVDQEAARRRERERPTLRDAAGGAGDVELAPPEIVVASIGAGPPVRDNVESHRTAAHAPTATRPETCSRAGEQTLAL